jgi:hypothetical protein
MTWAEAADEHQPNRERGEVSLVAPNERGELEASALGAGLLLVSVEPPRPALRGRLALLIETAVEEQLEHRGAPPPGVGASSDLDASLSDQLYRARLVGSSGLAISLHSLEGIANLAGALDAEDCAVLRWWIAATRERPVRLLLSAADCDLGVYDEPIALGVLVGARDAAGAAAEPAVRAPRAAPEVAQSAETMELGEPPPSVVEVASRVVVREDPEPTPSPVLATPVNDAEALLRAMAEIFDDEEPPASGPSAEIADAYAPTDPASDVAETPLDAECEPSPEVAAECAIVEPVAEQAVVEASEPATETEAVAAAPRRPPLDPNAPTEWERWMRELDGTRGPKPLGVVERTFVSAFVPLADAVHRGIAGEEALPVLQAWNKSFAQSYAEAFDALRVRGKRPTMVLDVPDLALRIGRLHGARSAQLVLVDGMRFDLGVRVNERLKPLLGQRAALTERLLLWSALPSTTSMQLELIGRGPQGLKELTGESDSEVPVARGRAAATMRRVRAGHREVLKLDLVESAMSVPGGPLAERLDDLADEVAEALANHLLRTPPRTLVLVFGDHGFTVEPSGGGTGPGRSGGASSEEVLVPAFAWLAGAVH